MRFLRQIAHLGALGCPSLAFEILVHAGHDFEQGRFTRTIDANDADFHAGQKVQVDILKAFLPARIGLGNAFHVVDILIRGHVDAPAGGNRVAGYVAIRALGRNYASDFDIQISAGKLV